MTQPNPVPSGERSHDPELLSEAQEAVVGGLLGSYALYRQLGPAGTELLDQVNVYGERPVQLDVASEAALLAALADMPVPVTVRSEEHGTRELNAESEGPRLLAVMDGLDGSSVYRRDWEHGRFGTMFAIFDNDNPTYDDFLAAGIMLHASGTLLLAVRGQRLQAIQVDSGEYTAPTTDDTALLRPGVVAYADKADVPDNHPLHDYFALNTTMADHIEVVTGVETVRSGSTAANVAAVAMGEAVLDLGATRKGNLEYATAWAIIKAAGGVMETIDGRSLGERRFLELGQRSHKPIIIAANESVAAQVREALIA